ncbi:MAG TPA: ABC transporter substrate-binding protein [Solirubrobacteraceae bacterium]
MGVVIAGVAGVVALAAATGASGSAPQHAAKLTTINVSLNFDPPGAEDTPIFYGIEKGLYKAQGLQLNIIPTKGSLFAVDNVGAGTADIGMADATTTMLAIGQGAPVVTVGTVYGSGGFGVFADKKLGITKLTQLAGHSVLVSAGSAGALLLPAALAAAHVKPGNVNIINVSSAALISTYVAGQGDAIATTIPSATPQIEPTRPSTALPFSNAGIVAPGYVLLVNKTGSLMTQHPKLIAAFLRATYKAIQGAKAYPLQAAQAVATLNPDDDINIPVYEAGWKNWIPDLCPPTHHSKPVGYPIGSDWSKAASVLSTSNALTGSTAASTFETDNFFTKYNSPAISTVKCP